MARRKPQDAPPSAPTSEQVQAANVSPQASGDGWELRQGDCLDLLRALPDSSVDAVVTDPPAGIGFMDKDWDGDKGGRDNWIAWLAERMTQCLRVLKPGGRLISWALPRTSHWTGEAIETSGLEILDVHHHIFGTGFPKSLNVSSAMHELLGVTDGEYGTALKPAVEHWIMAAKPREGTYAENIRAHGTGALNIGGCRAGNGNDVASAGGTRRSGGMMGESSSLGGWKPSPNTGRWPAHLSLDEYAAALLDEMSGECPSAGSTAAKADRKTDDRRGFEMQQGRLYPERTGGASRFFYVAKGSRAEKDAGLEHMPRRTGGEATGRVDGSKGTKNARAGAGRNGGARNTHPTVKSIELMRWLVRLIAPMPGALVVDPFAGSGTTGLGCLAEGKRFLGFELGPDYFDIARARLEAGSRQQWLFPAAVVETRGEEPETQVDLFAHMEAG